MLKYLVFCLCCLMQKRRPLSQTNISSNQPGYYCSMMLRLALYSDKGQSKAMTFYKSFKRAKANNVNKTFCGMSSIEKANVCEVLLSIPNVRHSPGEIHIHVLGPKHNSNCQMDLFVKTCQMTNK